MNTLITDLQLSLRLLRKSPGFTATVIAVLALGVGANTAIYSVIHAVLLNPFPYRDSERIMFIGSTREGQPGGMPVTYPDFVDFRQQAQKFEQLTFATNRALILTGEKEPASLSGAGVSASVWPLLGLQPQLGRVFTENEDRIGATPVCVISANLWSTRFGNDPKILGRSLLLDGVAHAVVGVMPPRFKFWGADVWIPVALSADTEFMRSRVLRLNTWAVGKIKPGVSIPEAEAELNVIAKRLSEQYPDSNRGVGVSMQPLSQSVTGPVRAPLLLLLGAVAFVLLIACANVANLLIARASSRQKEFAIRAALGASRGRLIRQVLFESLPLAVLGSAAGILIGAWGLDGLLALLPSDAIPMEAAISVNTPVMLLSLGACVGTMLLFSLVPALELAGTRLTGVMQDGVRGSTGPKSARIRSALIVGEIGLSLMLLVGAGLLIRSFSKLQSVNPGFRADHLLVMSLQLPETRYPTGERATQFYRELVANLRRLPGVTAAAAASNMPFLGGSGIPLLTADKTYANLNDLETVQFAAVDGEYFAAQGLRLLKGRAFTEMDRAGSEPVIILNEAAVKKFLPGRDPLGERVMLGLPANLITPGLLPAGLDKFSWARVVGVVESSRYFGLRTEMTPAAYLPVEQSWTASIIRHNAFVLLRTEGDPTLLTAAARSAVTALDTNQPIARVTTMQLTIDDSLRQSRFSTILLGLFAAVAATLAVVGIYGVVAWTVTQRTRELGIRAALGATREDVIRLVLGQGMKVVLIGLGAGLFGSLALTHLMEQMLFEVSAFDPWTFVVVAVLLGGVGVLACLAPALRASKVSPMEALRTD